MEASRAGYFSHEGTDKQHARSECKHGFKAGTSSTDETTQKEGRTEAVSVNGLVSDPTGPATPPPTGHTGLFLRAPRAGEPHAHGISASQSPAGTDRGRQEGFRVN